MMNFFDEYANNYDMSVPEIKYKYYHSYRVMDNMIMLAKNMNLPKQDVELAKYIGLLHDIARFPQFTKYQSFNDKHVDHGDLAVEILQKEDALKNFDIKKEDYDIVYKSIKYHNKYLLPENLSKRELQFSKMIRDADKLDIFYALTNPDIKWIVKEDDGIISKRVNDAFFENKTIKTTGNETVNDNIVIVLSFNYDIYSKNVLEIIKEEQYVEKIFVRIKNKELFKPYFDHIEKYLDERTR